MFEEHITVKIWHLAAFLAIGAMLGGIGVATAMIWIRSAIS
jgi:hypothetical protein